MSVEALKADAKRLRKAIFDLLETPITHSQALELVARTKNYPNWDAACACESRSEAAEASAVIEFGPSHPPPSLSELHLPCEDEWRHQLTSRSSGLFLITGLAGAGKSTTLGASMKEIGALPYVVEKGVDSGFASQVANCLPSRLKVVCIPEIRDESSAKAAIEAAKSGHRVLTTIHSKGIPVVLERLKALANDGQSLEELTCVVLAQSREDGSPQLSAECVVLEPADSSRSGKAGSYAQGSRLKGLPSGIALKRKKA